MSQTNLQSNGMKISSRIIGQGFTAWSALEDQLAGAQSNRDKTAIHIRHEVKILGISDSKTCSVGRCDFSVQQESWTL